MIEPGNILGRGWRERFRGTMVVLGALIALIALFAVAIPLSAQSLQKRIDKLLDTPPFNRQLWGVVLVDENGKVLYGRNADRMFVPASNTKLAVTTAASALFAPDWTVKTSIYGNGPVANGILQGDLVLYGRGDPTFSNRCYALDTTAAGVCDRDIFARFRLVADSLKARGITAVAGDLIGDGSYFEPQTVHGGWESYDLNWWYAAPVTGLAFNDNSVDIKWGPGPVLGAPASLTITPDLNDFTLENRSQTRTPAEDDIGDRMYRTPGTMQLWVDGSVGMGSKGGTEYFAMPDPNLFAARALRHALADAGIAVMGTTRSTVDSFDYHALRQQAPLVELQSRPLRDWVFPILNTSQNTFAEYLLKQLGRTFGNDGSWDGGIRVERRFLIDSVGIDSTQFSLRDGSGLASDNLVSPLAFTQMLRFIRKHPHWPTFAAGFPQSGKPGSLRTRFMGTPIEGRVWAKTGSISRVNTLSGFFETQAGKRFFFSIQANHHTQPGRMMLAQLDSIVVAMAKGR